MVYLRAALRPAPMDTALDTDSLRAERLSVSGVADICSRDAPSCAWLWMGDSGMAII